MALQGTLDSFALADVLQLVGGPGKVGALEVTASGHRTLLFMQDGSLTSATVDDALCEPSDTVLWLFRQEQGVFTFHNEARTDETTCSLPIVPLVADTQRKLAELKSLLAQVGSVDSWITLNPEPPTRELVISIERWHTIVLLGGGCTVSQLAALLGLDDLGSLRIVADLLRNHLVVCIDNPQIAASHETYDADAPRRRWSDEDPVAVEPGQVVWPADAQPSFPEGFAALDETWEAPVPALSAEAFAAYAPLGQVVADAPFAPSAAVEPPPLGSWAVPEPDGPMMPQQYSQPYAEPFRPDPAPAMVGGDGDLTAFAAELANLSPRAARAMARAARATSVQERDEALAEIEAENGHLNRGMLLRFLGTMEP